MKPIIKETLAKKQGKEKVLYFMYAYKEIIIGGLLAFVAIAFFIGSIVNKEEVIFQGKVLTQQGADNWLAAELTETYTKTLAPTDKQRVQVDAINLDDSQSAEVIATQLAAKNLDIIWLPETLVAEFVSHYDQDNLTESSISYHKNDTTYVARILPNAPHKEALEKITALYQ